MIKTCGEDEDGIDEDGLDDDDLYEDALVDDENDLDDYENDLDDDEDDLDDYEDEMTLSIIMMLPSGLATLGEQGWWRLRSQELPALQLRDHVPRYLAILSSPRIP